MASFSATDHRCMARALQLARRGWYTAHPNPRVGCVLALDDVIVGEGFHAVAGDSHAEINALKDAGERARGATAYVTLEPCAHHGKTGPCTRTLIDAGVTRVVAAMKDPYREVAGRGFEDLRAAGVRVEDGLMEAGARALNAGFLSRCERARPFLRLKVAASLDGRIAMAGGESRWITGSAARRDVHRLRASSGAILTGSGTILADDPSLTVRDGPEVRRQPVRAIVDSRLRTPADARILRQPGETVFYCVDDARRRTLQDTGAEVIAVAAFDERPDLNSVLADLAVRRVNDVLVEAGAVLNGALLDAGLVDELVIYQASHIMGSETRGLAVTPRWQTLASRRNLTIVERRQVGQDLKIVAVPGQRSP